MDNSQFLLLYLWNMWGRGLVKTSYEGGGSWLKMLNIVIWRGSKITWKTSWYL